MFDSLVVESESNYWWNFVTSSKNTGHKCWINTVKWSCHAHKLFNSKSKSTSMDSGHIIQLEKRRQWVYLLFEYDRQHRTEWKQKLTFQKGSFIPSISVACGCSSLSNESLIWADVIVQFIRLCIPSNGTKINTVPDACSTVETREVLFILYTEDMFFCVFGLYWECLKYFWNIIRGIRV